MTKLHQGQKAEIDELWKDTPISDRRLAKIFGVSYQVIRWHLNRNDYRAKQTARAKDWMKRNPERTRITQNKAIRAWQKRNPDYYKKRYWEDPEKYRAKSRQNYAKSRNK